MVSEASRLIELTRFGGPRGQLTPFEGGRDVPFEIRRVYTIHDVPAGQARGGHAHRRCFEVIVALHGSFLVTLDDGLARTTHRLDRPDRGLFVPPMIWRELTGFSTGSVCLVLASEHFDEADYVRDGDAFRELVRSPA